MDEAAAAHQEAVHVVHRYHTGPGFFINSYLIFAAVNATVWVYLLLALTNSVIVPCGPDLKELCSTLTSAAVVKRTLSTASAYSCCCSIAPYPSADPDIDVITEPGTGSANLKHAHECSAMQACTIWQLRWCPASLHPSRRRPSLQTLLPDCQSERDPD